MTTFLDGPAKGKTLMLSRQPVMLRVVRNIETGEIDALDKPEDTPAQNERVSVYYRKEIGPMCFLDGRNPKTRKKWSWNGRPSTYAIWPDATPEFSDRNKWEAWCQTQAETAFRLVGNPDEWWPISSAPKNAKEIRVKQKNGDIHDRAHWAQDLSGEEQPMFQGWFVPDGVKGYREISCVEFWQPIMT